MADEISVTAPLKYKPVQLKKDFKRRKLDEYAVYNQMRRLREMKNKGVEGQNALD
jgi:hypothetical protein